ncbi:C3HC4 type (RING finger) domain-containing protein [Hexamita inflata]|uniref:C3HC4 type (RING finger) domain-containing protein n=1 Tax=Hexamita inflata TaxID=28002 RepID=A0AA86RBP1_9EUKA|nr:C3HC4 type (RING finger) domain-containing protein [Hexamita inflata]
MHKTCTVQQPCSITTTRMLKKFSILPIESQKLVNDAVVIENFNCLLCFNQLTFPVLLPCGHSLCYECVQKQKQKMCPMCKKQFDENDLQIILLGQDDGKDQRPDNNIINQFKQQQTTLSGLQEQLEQLKIQNQKLKDEVSSKSSMMQQINKRYSIAVAMLITLSIYVFQK